MMKSNNNNIDKKKKSYKIVLLGDAKCGKTSLLDRYIKNIFNEEYVPTVFDSSSSEILLDKMGDMTIDLWDTSGSEEFDRLRPLSYEGVSLFLLCFDLSDPESLTNITRKWYEEAKGYKENVPIFLLGCKSDLTDPNKTVNKYINAAKQIKASAYYECSTKNPEGRKNIEQLFNYIALIVTGQHNKIPKSVKIKHKDEKHMKCVLL